MSQNIPARAEFDFYCELLRYHFFVLPQIGKEITGSVKEVFSALNVPVEWEEYNVSGETHGSERLFNEAMESLRRNKVGLKGWYRASATPNGLRSDMQQRLIDSEGPPDSHFVQAFSIHLSMHLHTTRGTLPCASASTSTPHLPYAGACPDSQLVTRMSTLSLSEKIQRESTPVSSIHRFQES